MPAYAWETGRKRRDVVTKACPSSRVFLPSFATRKYAFLVAVFLAGVSVRSVLDSVTSAVERQRRLQEWTSSTYDALPPRAYVNVKDLPSVVPPPESSSGWQTVNVFYGSVVAPPSDQRKYYSQVRQDEAVLSLLRNKTGGYFVDLAANNATDLSNTYALEREFGWSGLCIEPNPSYWYSLAHNRPRCQIVAAIVGAKTMEQVPFLYNGLEHGGIVGEGFDNRPKHEKSSVQGYTVTLEEIFQRFRVPSMIDYMSLDVEGAEGFIMSQFPLQSYTIRILTIERPKTELRDLLEVNGYKQILRLSRFGETLWIHHSVEEELDTTHLMDFHARKQYEDDKARRGALPQIPEPSIETQQ